MKQLIFTFLCAFISFSQVIAQDDDTLSNSKTLYTGIINISSTTFNYPLIGFVNLAYSEETGLILGFVNWSNRSMLGAQIGYFNLAKEEVTGAQLGFVNIARTLNGLQLGFINFSDSISTGTPLGFVSITARNGYQALDLSASSFGGVQLSLKTGIKKCYTSIGITQQVDSPIRIGLALGIGFIKDINRNLRFNPELQFNDSFSSDKIYANLNLGIGYSINEQLELYLCPAFLWKFGKDEDFMPILKFNKLEINDHNTLFLGFAFSLRYAFKWQS